MSNLFFFNDTATTEIYTLSLHDALPILPLVPVIRPAGRQQRAGRFGEQRGRIDRKSTRLNSSHVEISYAVFCLKKKTMTKPWIAFSIVQGWLSADDHRLTARCGRLGINA